MKNNNRLRKTLLACCLALLVLTSNFDVTINFNVKDSAAGDFNTHSFVTPVLAFPGCIRYK